MSQMLNQLDRNYATAYGNVVQTMGLIDTLESIVDDMSD